jgi:acetyltransferase-like isoleucine patch superfamily enzyme
MSSYATYGEYTYGKIKLMWESEQGKLSVGKFCSIGGNVIAYLGGNHNTRWITTYPFGHIFGNVFQHDGKGHPTTKGDIKIGNDVWIGDNVTIMSGVTIGDGAIIAGNSHVVKDVEPYSIIGGNPSKHIRFRFSETQIKKLLELRWWDWEISKIQTFIQLLCSDKIEEFFRLQN